MSHLDWRSPSAYGYLSDLDAAGLAWEFLRRNPNYRNDFSQFQQTRAFGAGAEGPSGPARSWGLSFLGRS